MTDKEKIDIDAAALAGLARLEFTEAELDERSEEIRAFAEFAACLDKYADGDDQLAHAPEACPTLLREDVARISDSDGIVELSAGACEGYISVPRTVDA